MMKNAESKNGEIKTPATIVAVKLNPAVLRELEAINLKYGTQQNIAQYVANKINRPPFHMAYVLAKHPSLN